MSARDPREALSRAGKMISELLVALDRERERSRNYKNLLRGATKACEQKNRELNLLKMEYKALTKIPWVGPPAAASAETPTPQDSSFVQLVKLSH